MKFKENFFAGITTLIVIGIFYVILSFVIGQIKRMWNSLYCLLPVQINSPVLEYIIFCVSTLAIIWLMGVIINLEPLAKLLNTLFARIPLVNNISKLFYRTREVINGILKYKMAICWHVPSVDFYIYGLVTNRTKVIKKAKNKTEQEYRFTIFVPTSPAPITGNIGEPNPTDLWLITNLNIAQLFRFFITGGADKPKDLYLEPLTNQYPEISAEIKTPKEPK